MRIKYNITTDDRVAVTLFHSRHSATIHRLNTFWGIVLPVAYFIFFCLLGLFQHKWGPPLFGFILGAILILWHLRGRRKRLEKITRKMLREGSNKESHRQHELELTETVLIAKTDYEESKIGWEAIERIGFTPDYTFIFIGPTSGIPIPRARVVEGDYERFTSQLRQIFENKFGTDNTIDIRQKIIVSPKEIYKEDLGSGRQSRVGIASFVISIMTVALYFLIFVVLIILAGVAPELMNRQSPITNVMTVLLLLGLFANMIGLVLGITGVTKKNRKKLLSILGLVLNSVILIVSLMLIVLKNVIS